jgi:DNA-binding transcriptional LysR family regulator
MSKLSPVGATALEYFVKIAELGSLTAAAQELHVSQPSLTVAVQRLERELETKLFIRSRRGVSLTSTGQVLMRHASHALRTLELARDEIHSLEEEPRGRFSLGCHESLGAYLLPGFMARFLKKNPQVDIILVNGNSRDVQHGVIDRRIDIGVVVNPQDHPELVIQPLFTDRVEFVVATALKKQCQPPLPALLTEHPLLHVPALRQVQFLLAAIGKTANAPRREIPCSSLELVKSLVLDGVGVGILPRRVASHGVPRGRLVLAHSSLPHFSDSITLVRRYDMHMTRGARILIDALKSHGQQMPPSDPIDGGEG